MMQDLFIRNTWRSWRTMGITGGMVPWDGGYVEIDGKITPAGVAMRENNAPTLAWIAGAASTTDKTAFTDKDHNFAPGQTVRKQIVLLNDSREAQPYSLTWQAMVDGKRVGGAKANGRIAVAQNIFVPLSFALPATVASAKVDGVITTNVTIGTAKHSDSFAFRVHRRVAAANTNVMVFDPTGKTTKLLQTLGYKTTAWDGKASTQLLVVGREAFSDAAKAPGNLDAFIRNGGRVLLMAQNPHWVREMLGLRVSHIQSRRVFPVAAHPVIAGLDSLDLRDWNGHSTMLDPRPDYMNGKGPDVKRAPSSYPYAGWRWGTRGTVSSGAIEKPHRSGWRPILEAEFDLQYSPLMELDYGKGRMVWSQLDVEDHAPVDPVARRVARQLVEYSRTAPLAPRRTTTYIGGEAGARQLDALGVQYEKAKRAVAADGLVVIGPDANISAEAIEALARNGARVLVLARSQNNATAGVQLARVGDFLGSLDAPNWPEARGLSASDLRWRNAGTAWLATGGNGAEIGGGGQLARRVVGKGVIVWAQINPEWTAADEKTYLRLTRWRQTRALSQLLANLGAGFEMDARVFQPAAPVLPPQVSLAGPWKARLVQRLEAAQSPDQGHPDPGMSTQARALLAADVNDGAWQSVDLPGDMAKAGGQWINADGEAVFRKTIEVPASLQGKELVLSLGTVDDFEETWFNGVRVGGVGADNPNAYSVKRVYTIPANLIKPGRNVIAVRVWDRFGGGGFTGKDFEMTLKEPEKEVTAVAGFYHPDYRDDWDMGDEPYRYYNW
jgi:beta-galactosidase